MNNCEQQTVRIKFFAEKWKYVIAALHRQVRRAAVDCGAANRRQLELWRRTTC